MKLWLLRATGPRLSAGGWTCSDSFQCPTGDVFWCSPTGNKALGNIKTSKMAQFTFRDGRNLTNPMRDICKKLQTATTTPLRFVLALTAFALYKVFVAAVTICIDSCCSAILVQSWRRADKLQPCCFAPLPWALSANISTTTSQVWMRSSEKNSCCMWWQVGFLFQTPGQSLAFRWAVRCGQHTGHLKPFSKTNQFLLLHPAKSSLSKELWVFPISIPLLPSATMHKVILCHLLLQTLCSL